MRLVDTHCHLDAPPLGEDPAAVLGRAAAADVDTVIVPAYDRASWDRLRALLPLPGVFVAFGIHPWVADDEGALRELRSWLANPTGAPQPAGSGTEVRAVAVGEIGLDAKEGPPLPVQVRLLRAQCRLARELDLPVILHCRGAFEELIDLLREFTPGLRGVIHAFARGPDLAARFLELGMHLAFGGAVTRDGRRARRSAPVVPSDRILLETDAPSIGLAGVPASETEPRHVATIAASLAGLRGVPVETIAAITTANAKALFGI